MLQHNQNKFTLGSIYTGDTWVRVYSKSLKSYRNIIKNELLILNNFVIERSNKTITEYDVLTGYHPNQYQFYTRLDISNLIISNSDMKTPLPKVNDKNGKPILFAFLSMALNEEFIIFPDVVINHFTLVSE